MRILVFGGASRNGVLTRMAASLAEGLRAAGGEVVHLPPGPDGPGAALSAAAEAGPFTHLVSFNGCAADLLHHPALAPSLAAGARRVDWLVDHPVWHRERLLAPGPERIVVSAAPGHVRALMRLGLDAKFHRTLPGAPPTRADEGIPFDRRPIWVVAAMSALGEPEVFWSGARGTPAGRLLDNAAARLIGGETGDVLTAFDAAAADLGLETPLHAAAASLLTRLDAFIRAHDRLRVAEAFADLDCPRLLIGSGWRERFGERPFLAYSDDLDVEDVNAAYGSARVVVNLNGANGGCERAVGAFAAGAAVVSDPSESLALEAPGAARFFRRGDPSTLREAVARLTGPEGAVLADEGRRLAAGPLSWTGVSDRLLARLAEAAGAPRRAA